MGNMLQQSLLLQFLTENCIVTEVQAHVPVQKEQQYKKQQTYGPVLNLFPMRVQKVSGSIHSVSHINRSSVPYRCRGGSFCRMSPRSVSLHSGRGVPRSIRRTPPLRSS